MRDDAQKITPGRVYYTWQNYVIKDWQPARPADKLQLAGFAIVLASFGKYGQHIYPSSLPLANRAGMSESTVKRLRSKVTGYGLFRLTGERKGRVRELEIAIPAGPPQNKPASGPEHAGDPGRDCPACVACIRNGGNTTDMYAAHWDTQRSLQPV